MLQDREFVEMEVPYNGAPKRPGSPSPLTSPAHSTASRGGLLHACCGRCYPQRYQVRGRRILASTTSISEGPPSSSSHSHQSQPSGQPVQSHYQPVDPITVPNVAFNVPGDSDRQRRQGASSSSPYNETRVWAELGTAIPPDRSFLSAWPVIEIIGSKIVPPYCSILVFLVSSFTTRAESFSLAEIARKSLRLTLPSYVARFVQITGRSCV